MIYMVNGTIGDYHYWNYFDSKTMTPANAVDEGIAKKAFLTPMGKYILDCEKFEEFIENFLPDDSACVLRETEEFVLYEEYGDYYEKPVQVFYKRPTSIS